jgi:hypothetical protein
MCQSQASLENMCANYGHPAARTRRTSLVGSGTGLAVLSCRYLLRCFADPVVILSLFLPPSSFSSKTLFLQTFSTFDASRGSPIITFLPMVLWLSLGGSKQQALPFEAHCQERYLINFHFSKTQSSLVESRLDLPMKNITIISHMRKRVMPFTISPSLQLFN